MIAASRPGWFDCREPSPARRLALAPLVLLAWGWGVGTAIVRWRRSRSPVRLPCRVVSVGSVVVGGSGKTPLAAWVAARLRERGHKVALASRGYGRRGRELVAVVSDGRFVRASVAEAGDEPLLLAGHAPGVPVLVGSDRAVVGLRAIAAFGIDVLVLDDGLQHRRLARDVELVSFDGSGLGNGRLLPRGPLREPLRVLAGADAVVVVDGPLADRDRERIGAAAGVARWFAARRHPVSVRPLAGGAAAPPAWLAGRRVGMLAGIARPESFRRTLESLGAHVVAERIFPDHHRYRERDIARLDADLPWITTEKDALKILPRWTGPAELHVLEAPVAVDQAPAFVEWLDRILRARRR